MSADNGIYIAKFPDGYRVCEGQAIENIDYFPEGTIQRKQTLRDYFGKSKVYFSIEEARSQAAELYDKILESDFPVCEYGIQYLGEYESFDGAQERHVIEEKIDFSGSDIEIVQESPVLEKMPYAIEFAFGGSDVQSLFKDLYENVKVLHYSVGESDWIYIRHPECGDYVVKFPKKNKNK